MDVILVPGLWLRGSSWDAVVPHLEAAGHRTHAITLPGADGAGAGDVRLDACLAAVLAPLDAADGEVVLVGHSAACALVTAAADARVDRVAHVVHVAGFPAADGEPVIGGFTPEDGALPFPGWDGFDEAELRDMDDDARDAFERRSGVSPACLTTEPVRLTDERRYDLPSTAVSTEYGTEQLRAWIDAGEAPVQEFPRYRAMRYVDLPTGHWPQLTRPAELAQVILDAIEGR